MLTLLATLCFAQTTNNVVLPIHWPNVTWLAPIGSTGKYLVATANKQDGPLILRIWPESPQSWKLNVDTWARDARISPDGRFVSVSRSSDVAVFEIGRSAPAVTGFSAGWLRGEAAALQYDERQDSTSLVVGPRRIAAPTGRTFLMLGDGGDYIATSRPAINHAVGEQKYVYRIELWKLGAMHKLTFVRSLGNHWWDSGSTGDPSMLAVAGNGTALIDEPAGGNALHFPILIPIRGDAKFRPFALVHRKWTQMSGSPIAFAKGIVCPVWIVEDEDEDRWNESGQQQTLLSYGTTWLAWLDGSSIRIWRTPVGFVNAWMLGGDRLGYSARTAGGFQICNTVVPPANWFKP